MDKQHPDRIRDALRLYTNDLQPTIDESAPDLPADFMHEREVHEIVAILQRRPARKRNPMVAGESSFERMDIVMEAARRLRLNGSLPIDSQQMIASLNMDALVASVTPQGALDRLALVFEGAALSAGRIVLYVEHFHRLVGGEWEHYPIDAAPLLKCQLGRRALQMIGATSLSAYRTSIECDAALNRLFQHVLVSATPERET